MIYIKNDITVREVSHFTQKIKMIKHIEYWYLLLVIVRYMLCGITFFYGVRSYVSLFVNSLFV